MASSWVRVLVGIVAFFVVARRSGSNVDRAARCTADPTTGLIAAQGDDHRDPRDRVCSSGSSATRPPSTPRRGRLDSITSQFRHRVIVLIPIAIAINIILGQTVSAALKVPIYLDSIGTILVGVLAGPIAGALTGGLANLIWTYVLPAPFHSDFAAPFFIVAVEIGLLAGHLRPARVLPEPPQHAGDQARDRRDRGRRRSSRVIGYLRVHPVLHERRRSLLRRGPDRRRPVLRDPGLARRAAADRARSSGCIALLVRAARPRRGVRLRRRADLRDRVRDHLGADLGRRLRRRHRLGHGPPRGRVPAGRRRPPDGGAQAGPAVGPDRQDADLLRRLRDRSARSAGGSSPGSRRAKRPSVSRTTWSRPIEPSATGGAEQLSSGAAALRPRTRRSSRASPRRLRRRTTA